MANKSKAIGRDAENGLVEYLIENGWPHAERRVQHGSQDRGDVGGTPGVVFEMKSGEAAYNASDNQLTDWLIETEIERDNAGADIGILVCKRYRVGKRDAGRWYAHMTLMDLLRLHGGAYRTPGPVLGSRIVRMQLQHVCEMLRVAGYGEPV